MGEQQIKNSFLYLLPSFVGNLIPLITLPIFTRILSTEDYGAWALAQIYATFAITLANFGLMVGYERNFFECRDPIKSGALLYSTLVFVASTTCFTAMVTYFLRFHLSRWIIGSDTHADLLFWSTCCTGIISMKTYYLTYFKNSENAWSFSYYMIDEYILGSLFCLFWVAYLRVGVIGLVWGQMGASTIILTALAIRFLKRLPFSFSRSILVYSIKLSYPLTPRAFFKVIGTQFDKYLIGMLATVGAVGVYTISQKVAYLVFTFMNAIENVFLPQVYKKMFDLGEKGHRAVGEYLTPFAYLSILVATMVSLFSEEIITILTPSSYHGGINIVTILSVLYGIWFFGKIPQLIYAKKTYISSLLSALNIVLNIAINIPFISMWGATGAALGTLLAGTIGGAVSFAISQRCYEIKWEYVKIAAIYGTFLVASAVTILLRLWEIPYYIRILVKLFCCAGYAYLGIRFGIISVSNYHLVRNTVLGIFARRVPKEASEKI